MGQLWRHNSPSRGRLAFPEKRPLGLLEYFAELLELLDDTSTPLWLSPILWRIAPPSSPPRPPPSPSTPTRSGASRRTTGAPSASRSLRTRATIRGTVPRPRRG